MFHSLAGAVRHAAESWKNYTMPSFSTNRSATADPGGWQREKCAWRSSSPRKKERRSSYLIRSRLRKRIEAFTVFRVHRCATVVLDTVISVSGFTFLVNQKPRTRN